MIFSKPQRDYEKCIYFQCIGCCVCHRLILNFNIRTKFLKLLVDWFLAPKNTIVPVVDFVNYLVFHYHMLVHSPVTWTSDFFQLQQKIKNLLFLVKRDNFLQIPVAHTYSADVLASVLGCRRSGNLKFLDVFLRDRFDFKNKFDQTQFTSIDGTLIRHITNQVRTTLKSDLGPIDVFEPFICGRTRENEAVIDNNSIAYFKQFLIKSYFNKPLVNTTTLTILFKIYELT